ncbi:MAG: hypothetical protein K2X49_19625 [Acetobacteraceae bacterium]|nr:hypothetical protein [Acetobacteraceae bacterium]
MNAQTQPLVDVAEVYRQQNMRFTRLNDILHRTPPTFSALIGGLWYFAFQQMDQRPVLAALVFIVAALVGHAGINVFNRLRVFITAYLDSIARFEKPHEMPRPAGTSIARYVIRLLGLAMALSVAGALWSLAGAFGFRL